MFPINFSCFLKCVEKNLVKYSYFGSCPRSEQFLHDKLQVMFHDLLGFALGPPPRSRLNTKFWQP